MKSRRRTSTSPRCSRTFSTIPRSKRESRKTRDMAKQAAILFRRKVYVVSPNHKDAIDLAFKGMSPHQIGRICDRIAAGKEDIVFGFAYIDGSEFKSTDMQSARKRMYGLD